MENKIVLFETNDNTIKLEVPVEGETVWLSANQMAELFDRDEKTIRKHINNVFSEADEYSAGSEPLYPLERATLSAW